MIKVKNVSWDLDLLSVLLELDGEEKLVLGSCNIPYHPSKFNVPELRYGVFTIYNKLLKVVSPKSWSAESYVEAMKKTKINYVLRRDVCGMDSLLWKRNGSLVYERVFQDNVVYPPFLPQPVTRGVRVFMLDERVIRIVLYYLEEVRIDKWDLKL
jgi:hypothetical protein